MKTLKLSDDDLNDLLSASTFTRTEYERVRKQKAPSFKRALNKIEKKLWVALGSKK